MKRVYLVMGEGGTGKSTLIRCLTGLRQKGRPFVTLTNSTRINIWCYMRSIQEMDPIMSPLDVINDITQPSESAFIDYLIPFRIDGRYGYQGIVPYLQALLNTPNLTIVNAVALDIDAQSYPQLAGLPFPSNIPITYIPNSKSNTPNQNASIVRNAWGWI